MERKERRKRAMAVMRHDPDALRQSPQHNSLPSTGIKHNEAALPYIDDLESLG